MLFGLCRSGSHYDRRPGIRCVDYGFLWQRPVVLFGAANKGRSFLGLVRRADCGNLPGSGFLKSRSAPLGALSIIFLLTSEEYYNDYDAMYEEAYEYYKWTPGNT